ncbi:MAG: tRNA preQ1(34) S-adenosylmethionine ribosyltransferase-isomerase QueA [Chloroflexota bacterium]
MQTSLFDYVLPEGLIAQEPADPRDSSRLMVLDRTTGSRKHLRFHQIDQVLRSGDLLILNNTKVHRGRIFGRKSMTGGKVEMLLLEPVDDVAWLALVGGKRIRIGTTIEVLTSAGEPSGVIATVTKEDSGSQRVVSFNLPSDEWIDILGSMPLPPYIREYTGDPERYQTVFARHDGSAAAPTAGLHFTPDLLIRLRNMGVGLEYITLSIGLDTFKPIEVDDIDDHEIHTEWSSIDSSTAIAINETKLRGGRIVAVGTTVVRTLESAARNLFTNCDTSICSWRSVSAGEGPTDLFIKPGFDFRVVDALVTNFHLPRSSLLVLVSAFANHQMIFEAYHDAVAHEYRFYSFGDAMIIV